MASDAIRTELLGQLRLPGHLRDALKQDQRRIIVVGAGGWIGRTTIELMAEALGETLDQRLVCFGSSKRQLELSDGRVIEQLPLEELGQLDRRASLLFHLAFLTKDKVAQMDTADYEAGNRKISDLVLGALDKIGVDRVFLSSSGAAAFAGDPAAAADLRMYGAIKLADEALFAAWAQQDAGRRRAAICRIYSVSGPFINKHAVYALADFILHAQHGRTIKVSSPRAVWRSYVAVKEIVALAAAILLAETGDCVQRFDTGGVPYELGDVAGHVAAVLGGQAQQRAINDDEANRYCGDHASWLKLLQNHRLEHLDIADQIRETAGYMAALDAAGTSG